MGTDNITYEDMMEYYVIKNKLTGLYAYAGTWVTLDKAYFHSYTIKHYGANLEDYKELVSLRDEIRALINGN